LLAACGGFPDFAPSDAGVRAIDPRLGVEVARSPHAFRFASTFEANGPLIVWEEVGVGWNASSGTAPPLDPGAVVLLGRDTSIATVRDSDILIYTGTAWTALPPPPIDATGMFPSQLLVHDGRTYVVIADHLFVYDGAAWTSPLGGVVGLGGYDATTQWVYASGAWHALGGTAVVTAPAPSGSAINGDAAGFQYDAAGVMQTFDGATVTAHDPASGTPWSAPGSHRVIVSADGPPPRRSPRTCIARATTRWTSWSCVLRRMQRRSRW
jgi:hypothetical protein